MGNVLSSIVFCQEQIKPLAIGDTLPELPFHQVINYPKEKLKLSDFKGKLLILDFWNTWCSACLASFPKLSSLQRIYKDQLMILPVVSGRTSRKKEFVDFYKMRAEMGVPIELPSIVEDTILMNLFPHKSLPHIVFIDNEGVIRLISGSVDLNSENINEILEGRNNSSSNKVMPSTIYDDYNEDKPLLLNGNGGMDDQFIQKSVLIKNLKVKTGGNIKILRDSSHTRITLLNMKLPYLFITPFLALYPDKFATLTGDYLHKEYVSETNNEVVKKAIQVANREIPKTREVKDFYSYELIIQGNRSEEEMLKAMITDLNRLFKINVHLQQRKISAIELSVSDTALLNKSKYKVGRSYSDVKKSLDSTKFIFVNSSIKNVAYTLNWHLNLPFIYSNQIDFINYDIHFDLSNGGSFKEVQSVLSKIGIRAKKVNKSFEVLVFSD
ncbi:hypothetical protein M472_14800 [Sphingobacterium paucimobilis HER1398]|uniref:Thioredoxin domain-containing protein n=2 Tax=Sphingobacterium TaxID=28453 RepID=U2HE70_9SPHI|nr:hypothetical protein M472_14800 [Sphingobacterium paucimobilis HER1398]